MIEKINLWLLSSTFRYSEGVALYVAYGSSLMLKHKLLKGNTAENRKLLHDALIALVPPIKTETETKSIVVLSEKLAEAPAPHEPVPDPELCAVLRTNAHKNWKELMNKRALLFGLCKHEAWEDENSADRVNLRGGLALDIISFNRKVVNPAYDKLRYAEKFGCLPVPPAALNDAEDDYSHLTDLMVKPTIDNLRKNLSKLRKREQTPERVALISRHEANLTKFLARWHSLK